jgi:hypothetical protein
MKERKFDRAGAFNMQARARARHTKANVIRNQTKNEDMSGDFN